jgi:hypothetical protein
MMNNRYFYGYIIAVAMRAVGNTATVLNVTLSSNMMKIHSAKCMSGLTHWMNYSITGGWSSKKRKENRCKPLDGPS